MDKEGSLSGIFVVMIITLLLAFSWNSFSFIRESVGSILNPTAGALLNFNLTWGMFLLIFVLSLFMTLIQKYTTDQETLRKLKKEQKDLQEEMKKVDRGSKEHNEMTMKSLKFVVPMMKLSMRPMMFTGIPLILFFRWFIDFFSAAGDPKFFGFFNWFWFYLLGSIIISSILRKVLKVA